MGDQYYGHRPENGLERVFFERFEILGEKFRGAFQMAQQRCHDVLETPACHDGVIAHDKHPGEHAEVAHGRPWRAARQAVVSPGGVGCGVAPDYEFADHARYAEQQHTADVNQYERGSPVFPGHVREAPDVAQAYRRAGRGEDHTELAAEVYSLMLCHVCVSFFVP